MSAAAIATPAPSLTAIGLFDSTVAIYQLAREFELWLWLCPACLAARTSAGWQIRARKLPPPRELLLFLGPAAYCAAALDDRSELPCTDCATAHHATHEGEQHAARPAA